MRKTLAILIVLLVSGCVSDKGSAPDTSSGAKSSSDSDDASDKKRDDKCFATTEGGEGKTICY